MGTCGPLRREHLTGEQQIRRKLERTCVPRILHQLSTPENKPTPRGNPASHQGEAGKGLARLAQAEQPLDRGSVLSHLGAGLQLRRCGSSLGPFQYRLARTRWQPNSSLPRAGTGHPGLVSSCGGILELTRDEALIHCTKPSGVPRGPSQLHSTPDFSEAPGEAP